MPLFSPLRRVSVLAVLCFVLLGVTAYFFFRDGAETVFDTPESPPATRAVPPAPGMVEAAPPDDEVEAPTSAPLAAPAVAPTSEEGLGERRYSGRDLERDQLALLLLLGRLERQRRIISEAALEGNLRARARRELLRKAVNLHALRFELERQEARIPYASNALGMKSEAWRERLRTTHTEIYEEYHRTVRRYRLLVYELFVSGFEERRGLDVIPVIDAYVRAESLCREHPEPVERSNFCEWADWFREVLLVGDREALKEAIRWAEKLFPKRPGPEPHPVH